MHRRHFIKASGAAMVAGLVRRLGAAEVNRLKVGVICDEVSNDLEAALRFLQGYGLRYVEVRKVWNDTFVTEADDATIRKVRDLLAKYKMTAPVLDTAHMKTTYPGTTPIEIDRDQFQLFNLDYNDQPVLLDRCIARAKELGIPHIRVFSGWRTPQPEKLFDRIANDLTKTAETAAKQKIKVVLENEHSCNIATGPETARILKMVDHPNLGLVWDPGNAYAVGTTPYPDGYSVLPKNRIWHTHLKDAVRDPATRKHKWMPIQKGDIKYVEQLRALIKDGYQGMFSLETHYIHPTGNKELASKESIEGLLDALKKA